MAGPIRCIRGSSPRNGPGLRHTKGQAINECTHIGLDVHKDTIAVAVLRPGTTEVDERVIPNTPEAIRRFLSRHDPDATHACYEAGPSGYDTQRTIAALRLAYDVIAPSMIPHRSGSCVKTVCLSIEKLTTPSSSTSAVS